MLRLAIFVATSLLVGCPSKQPEAPRTPEDSALRIRIAQAEARRSAGVDELIALARGSDLHARELALRGLGRVGGAKAVAALEQALDDTEPKVVTAALYAIGVLAALDEDPSFKAGAKLVAALARAPLPALEALGRAGDATVQGDVATRLADRDPAVASAAAFALGRHGRRKIAWSADARVALAKATAHAEASVRYAATYALSREHEPPPDDVVTAALIARISDADAETRAAAIAGLARRKAIGGNARAPIVASLRDRDWRVAVEAVRALAGGSSDDAGKVAVAESLPQRWAELVKGNSADAHIIAEALRSLAANPTGDDRALAAVDKVAQAARADSAVAPLARGWIHCLGLLAIVKLGFVDTKLPAAAADAVERLAKCHAGLPDHLRLPLLADYMEPPVGDAATRRAVLRILLAHDDPRVRAAALTALSKSWNDGDAKAQATIVGTVSSALATKNPIVAGTAVDVAGELYDRLAAGDPLRAQLDAAILARATIETDIELAGSLYAVIGKRTIAGGADACRAGLAGQPARAHAAAVCLKALGEPAAAPAGAAAEPPPGLDVATVIGKRLYWHLATARGEIVIELHPDVAPWAVASIVALTRRGFYDGLEFHRVVPNFVVQGGDPTMSGWGGPGYTLPAEPASGSDGWGYVIGGVGIADAGRDSGGSQWFIMHSRAPHLDGRYTWIGSVVSGQKSADALLIGDRVDKATIEQR